LLKEFLNPASQNESGVFFLKRKKIIIILTGLLFISCAFDVAHVSYHPTDLTPQPLSGKSITLKQEVKITDAPCGYSRTLREGSNWDLIGSIPEGNVYKPRDQVLTVECSNVYEAYLVCVNQSLVGFYLPVEHGFVALKTARDLPAD
jgi:hypothetical protein